MIDVNRFSKSLRDGSDAHHPQFSIFPSRRSLVLGRKGIVASPNALASSAGLEILNNGGNAADASIATAAVLSLVDPSMCGLGGDGFSMFYESSSKSLRGINGSGRSPASLNLNLLKNSLGGLDLKANQIPIDSIHAITVPGACGCWIDTIKNFGSGKLSLSEILRPAIELAKEGFPVSEISSWTWKNSQDHLLKTINGTQVLLKEGQTYRAPRTGELMFNLDLARTFEEIADKGWEGFYKGRVAQGIVNVIKSQGGVIELSDLNAHTSSLVQPISKTYNPFDKDKEKITLHELPPNGQGLTALMALGILESLEKRGIVKMNKLEPNSAPWIHTLIECLRLAFADTRAYIADPDIVYVPTLELLDKDYLFNRSLEFNLYRAQVDIQKGSPMRNQETVYLTCNDKEGNACSFIMSNYTDFGSGIVPDGCGFVLQNRGSNFNLQEGHPNCIEPKKRPYHTIIPAMVTKGDDLFLSFGVMGGFMQPQGHLQVLMNIINGNYNVQSALDCPRFCISGGTPSPSNELVNDINGIIYLEEGIKLSVVEELKRMGHKVELVKDHQRSMFGRGQVIQKVKSYNGDDQTVWVAGSDPRADGQAVCQV
ncbi:nucleophile aminohydrolase [Phakopsora pachyrhizi]|uniref:Nucleophile aminohydrolase n=1 Tax=Phakopsora pachyrhizi TaxID=170000 RepID=A0AAV0BJ24_PHAPC|nr:nucleophile aminohydrolase [Phakopsora pachyrhizi]